MVDRMFNVVVDGRAAAAAAVAAAAATATGAVAIAAALLWPSRLQCDTHQRM